MHGRVSFRLTRALLGATWIGLAAVAGCGGGGDAGGTGEDGTTSGREVPATLGKQLAEANRISSIEGDIKQEQARFVELARQYEQKTGQKLQGIELSPDQQKMLQDMLQQEKDVSYSGLIQDILDRQKKIDDLEGQIDKLKGSLPKPLVVQKGETHYKIALRWLTEEKGLSKQDAEKLIKRAMLSDHLAQGHEVWNFYEDGVFASAVTQGSARISPYLLNLSYERKITSQRDDAVARADQLAAEMDVLTAQRDQLQSDIVRLEEQRAQLQVERDQYAQRTTELETFTASTRYYIDTKRNLKEAEILEGQKLVNTRPELFDRSLDLRNENRIVVRASDHDLKKVSDATILPNQLFLKKRDYTVEVSSDKQRLTIDLANADKFTNASFVVLVK